MNITMKGLAGAVLGLALGAAAAPAYAIPTSGGPVPSSDYGVSGIGDTANAYQLTLSYIRNDGGTASRTFGAKGTGFSYGSNGSYSPIPSSIGSFGGEDFRTSLNFSLSGLDAPFGTGTREYRVASATLELPYTSITGMPIIAALASGLGGNSSSLLTSGSFAGQSFTLQPSATPGIAKLTFNSTFTSNLSSFLSENAGSSRFVQVALSATNGGPGAGAPGPVAGAGLPFVAAAGLAWIRRRRRARTGS